MAELRDVIRRLKLGHGVRDIQRSTGVHRTIVRQLRELALELGWLEADHELPSEQQIEEVRSRWDGARNGKSLFQQLSAHEEEFQRWHKQEYTAVVMHDLIRDRVPCFLSTVDGYLRHRFPKPVAPKGRRDTIAGKVMEVDFGYLGITYDPNSRRNRRTWVFSARLRHSRRAWRERCFDQKQQTFFVCHIHAFEFFGGVVERVVPDYVPRNIIRLMCPLPLCGGSEVVTREADQIG
jgi:hypothetical protein